VGWNEEQAHRAELYLASLRGDALAWVYLAPDFPGSAYKVYIQKRRHGPWWKFDVGSVGAKVCAPGFTPPRPRHKPVICAARDLAHFAHDPSKPALVALFRRAAELSREG
jgi:hypothetical protein